MVTPTYVLIGWLVERIRYTDHDLDFACVFLDRGNDDDEDGCCGCGCGGFDEEVLSFTERNVLDSNLVIWSDEMDWLTNRPTVMFRKRPRSCVILF